MNLIVFANKLRNIFNNREIALGIWFVLFLVFFLRKKNIRTSFIKLIKSFFAKKIIMLNVFIIIYILSIVKLLSKVDFWEIYLLKDTIYWAIFTAFVLMINLDEKKDLDYFKSIVKSTITYTIIIEFITNYYSYSILLEMIIVPVIFLTILMQANLERSSKKYGENGEKMKKIFNTLLMSSTAFFFLHSIIMMTVNYEKTISFISLKQLFISPILTILYLPVLYLIALIITYESLFTRLSLKKEISDRSKIKFILKTIYNCKLNLNKLVFFLDNHRFLISSTISNKKMSNAFKKLSVTYQEK